MAPPPLQPQVKPLKVILHPNGVDRLESLVSERELVVWLGDFEMAGRAAAG